MSHVILMLHAMTGALFILSAVWVYVETLNVNEGNVARLRLAGKLTAGLMWLTFLIGGFWYVFFYAPDKAAILKGPWPDAHDFFMETKEHIVIALLPLATFIPIVASNDLLRSRTARTLLLWMAALAIVTGLTMEGAGGIISMGAKLGLMIH